MLEEVTPDTAEPEKLLPIAKSTLKEDLITALRELNIRCKVQDPDARWALARPKGDSIAIEEHEVMESLVPRVIGMGAKDALFLLENQGLKVKMIGSGVVRQQSIIPGTRATRGREIIIRLS